MKRTLLLLMTLTVAVACRPDPGEPTYSALDDFDAPFGFVEPLEGPDPYQDGIGRLTFGIFYEGRSSQVYPVDDQVVFYYIFQNADALTYTQSVSDDRVEGVESSRLSHAGGPWWGGGIFSDAPRDFTAWKTLRISLKSRATAFEAMTIGMAAGMDDTVTVNARDYGFLADGEWHHLVIPVQDFVDGGLDVTGVTGFLVLGGAAAEAGQSVLVDNLYFSQAP